MLSNSFEHPKVRHLARLLKIPRLHAVGICGQLWNLTAKTAPQGNIGKFADEDLALSCDWDGDPKEFVGALVKCRLLDVHPDPKIRLLVHDWCDHMPYWVKGNLARMGLDVLEYVPKSAPKSVPKSVPKKVLKNVPKKGSAKVELEYVPKSALESPLEYVLGSALPTPSPSSDPEGSMSSSDSPETPPSPSTPLDKSAQVRTLPPRDRPKLQALASTLYGVYPRRVARTAAIKAIEKAIRDVASRQSCDLESATEWLRIRVDAFASKCKRDSVEPRYIAHPATWFNRGSFDDDDLQPRNVPGISGKSPVVLQRDPKPTSVEPQHWVVERKDGTISRTYARPGVDRKLVLDANPDAVRICEIRSIPPGSDEPQVLQLVQTPT